MATPNMLTAASSLVLAIWIILFAVVDDLDDVWGIVLGAVAAILAVVALVMLARLRAGPEPQVGARIRER